MKILRILLVYTVGIICLIGYKFLDSNARVQEILEKSGRVSEPDELTMNATFGLLQFALLIIGVSAICFQTYFLVNKLMRKS